MIQVYRITWHEHGLNHRAHLHQLINCCLLWYLWFTFLLN